LTIKNKYIDTAYNFNIAFSINGGKPVTALVTNKILVATLLLFLSIQTSVLMPLVMCC